MGVEHIGEEPAGRGSVAGGTWGASRWTVQPPETLWILSL